MTDSWGSPPEAILATVTELRQMQLSNLESRITVLKQALA